MDDVLIYVVFVWVMDLFGLFFVFIDCGSVEVFCDEDVVYVLRFWEVGV